MGRDFQRILTVPLTVSSGRKLPGLDLDEAGRLTTSPSLETSPRGGEGQLWAHVHVLVECDRDVIALYFDTEKGSSWRGLIFLHDKTRY